MAATVESTAFGNALRLNADNVFRRPAIGTAWTKIRLAFRLQLLDAGTPNTPASVLHFGLCSGSDEPFDPGFPTTNFVGWRTSSATAWTYGAADYYRPVWIVTSRVGTADNLVPVAGQFYLQTDTSNMRSGFFVDITKGSPNYTVAGWCRSGSGAVADFDDASLAAQLAADPPTFAGYNTFSNTVACDEVPGTFDHVCFGCSGALHDVIVHDLTIKILA